MTLLLRVLGPALTLLAALVLVTVFRGLWRAQRHLQSVGINGAIPLGPGPRAIVFLWMAAFLIGLALTVYAYS